MKMILIKLACICMVSIFSATLTAQHVGINATGAVPDPSAILDVKSDSLGLLVPRMTLVQRDAIKLPAVGLLVYVTDYNPGFYVNKGTTATPWWNNLVDNSTNLFGRNSDILYNAGGSNHDFMIGDRYYPGDGNSSEQHNILMFTTHDGSFRAGSLDPSNGSAWGLDNLGLFSFAGNHNTEATAISSAAFGERSIANGVGSFATGIQTRTLAYGNLTAGIGTLANSYAATAVGMYNDTALANRTGVVGTNPIFSVGIGTAENARKNALTILKNGNTGIGISTPVTKLQITEGTDASLVANSGHMVIGNTSGTNIVFDDNEIIARNNGVNAPLYLQNEGGDLYTKGPAYKPGGGAWLAVSDGRLKKNITSYNDGLSQLLQINPVHFQYNELSGYDTAKQYIGVIAQDLKKVAPYMVEQDTSGTLRVDNSAMVYMLINAVKELQAQVELLQKKSGN